MVTQDDLHSFHAHIFGSPAPTQLFRTQEPHSDTVYEDFVETQNDDLGYYPDGAKRTLTDDQIAMFRHSEIYSILRERQVHRENLEAEGGIQPETISSRPEEDVEATSLSDEEGEVQSDGEVKEDFAAVLESTSQHAEATSTGKKRKREDISTGHVHGRKQASRSARGFVRELDSAAAEDQILDYGDEPSVVEGSKENDFSVTEVAEQGREGQARRAEGKRIWWPIIEAT